MLNSRILEKRLLLRLCAAAACIIAVTMLAIVPLYRDYCAARRSAKDILYFKRMVDVEIFLAAERGPSAVVMSLEPGENLIWAKRLSDYRDRTDRSLSNFGSANANNSNIIQKLDEVREQLRVSRAKIDAQAFKPIVALDERSYQNAIDSLRETAWSYQRIVTTETASIVGENPSVASEIFFALMLTDLREHGGQSAGDLVASLATHSPLSPSNELNIKKNITRVYELWSIIKIQSTIYPEESLRAKLYQIEQRFLQDGFLPIEDALKSSADGEYYSISVIDFVQQFAPTLKYIEDYRDAFLQRMLTKSIQRQHEALHFLGFIISLALGALIFLLSVLGSIRIKIFQPLLKVQKELMELAEEIPHTQGHGVLNVNEVRNIWGTIEKLRGRIAARAELISILREQAEIDSLTGLANRRALEHYIKGPSNFPDKDASICLILIDIDHFKNINDTFGHAAGDAVLQQASKLISKTLQADGFAARIGGEEFAIIISRVRLGDAGKFAENIRVIIKSERFFLPDGRDISITISSGVAQGRRSAKDWDRLFSCADEALYRAKTGGRDRVLIDSGTY